MLTIDSSHLYEIECLLKETQMRLLMSNQVKKWQSFISVESKRMFLSYPSVFGITMSVTFPGFTINSIWLFGEEE